MCLSASSPVSYSRPNPQDIYYNGNIYDPKPPKKEEPKMVMGKGGELRPHDERIDNPLNKTSTGLQIQ